MSPFLCFREASERRLSRMDCLNGDKFERFQEFKKNGVCFSHKFFFAEVLVNVYFQLTEITIF